MCPNGLIKITHFVHVRIRYPVRAYQTVITEIIIRTIVLIKISAIRIYLYAVLIFPTHRLVNKVPDESTLKFGIFAYQVPIFFESTHRITHSMRIFTLYKRFSGITLGIILASAIPQIHRAENIGIIIMTGLFILHGARCIFRFYPTIASFEIRTGTGFVTQRPDNDRRMIVTTLHITLVAFQMCFGKRRVFRKLIISI